MYRLHLYLTPQLKNTLDSKAKMLGKSRAEVAREALEEGLKKPAPSPTESAKALVNLAQLAEALPVRQKAPQDAVAKLDSYTWSNVRGE